MDVQAASGMMVVPDIGIVPVGTIGVIVFRDIDMVPVDAIGMIAQAASGRIVVRKMQASVDPHANSTQVYSTPHTRASMHLR
eukprot:6978797-Prymnesium_polylepis.1